MIDLQHLFDAIVDGDHKAAKALTEEAIAQWRRPQGIADEIHDSGHERSGTSV